MKSVPKRGSVGSVELVTRLLTLDPTLPRFGTDVIGTGELWPDTTKFWVDCNRARICYIFLAL